MIIFCVLKPDKTPVESPFLSMADAQSYIAAVEVDPVAQSKYQIHPISEFSQLKALGVKHREKVTIEKFDGEYVGQKPVEVVEFNYGD